MTINNGTKKIEVPPKGIPCTCYVGSSVGRISIVIWFLFVCARDCLLQWCEVLSTKIFSLIVARNCVFIMSILITSLFWVLLCLKYFPKFAHIIIRFFMYLLFMWYVRRVLEWYRWCYFGVQMCRISFELIMICFCVRASGAMILFWFGGWIRVHIIVCF